MFVCPVSNVVQQPKKLHPGRIECTEQSTKFATIGNTFSTLFSALFGLGDADDPDVMKRNLLIADDPENKGHKDRLTMEHRRQLCDSDRLSFQELEALMASVSEKKEITCYTFDL